MESKALKLQTILGAVEKASLLQKELFKRKRDKDSQSDESKIVLALGTEIPE